MITSPAAKAKISRPRPRWVRCEAGGERKEFTAWGKRGLPHRAVKTQRNRLNHTPQVREHVDFYPRAALAGVAIETLAYAKAAEEEKVQQTLHAHGIKPLLQNRALWQSEPERPRPGSPGRSPLQVVHHEAGTRSCYDRVSNPPGRHQLAYVG